MTASTLATLVQHFFTARLCAQMQASQHTIASYRDTFRLLLRYASSELHKSPTALAIEDLDANLIGRFLLHIETARSNGARSRNTRLAAIRSFFRHAALHEPALLLHCQKILAMPSKRFDRRAVAFLDNTEMEALSSAPNRSTWTGRRDHALLVLALQTGLRASEIVGLNVRDIVFGVGGHVRCLGKGRKERCTPLRRATIKVLTVWLREREGSPDQPVFPTISGRRLSRDALEKLVKRHVDCAKRSCSTLANKRVTPHVLRHSTAMDLLRHGVDQSVIALWLGHETIATTQIYIHADMQLKERALAKLPVSNIKSGRYRPDDQLLAFLEAL